ncbi:hypothetical protein [Variovorax sp. Sphag1AA]|uniref:hypothetical protein n=1 Tax=Variovorax sp. Sphag1AA TaxID=2587027 RepID=UPI00160CCCE0|nr:hypothetical protein [Variovorax sp. Sphag1AA]MBB3181437.1 hypothetical protein [Variovorax sp. Sphag1AA]
MHKGTATPEAPSEDDLLARRRAEINPGESTDATGHRGLALSGGGIRSATFALGVLETIAKHDTNDKPGSPTKPGDLFRSSFLSRFDYLSTVSGGGYIGAFLCSLFQPNRLRRHGPSRASTQSPPPKRHSLFGSLFSRLKRATTDENPGRSFTAEEAAKAADDAVRVLQSGPPGRIRSSGPFDGNAILEAPMAWLRENGRYLIPTGTGDAFYAAALGIRNWLALHYVIGTVLLAALAGVGVLRALAAYYFPFVMDWEVSVLQASLYAASEPTFVPHIWWSSLFPLSLVPPVVIGLPLGIAFWLVHERRDGKSLPLNLAVLGSVVIVLLMVGISFLGLKGGPFQSYASKDLDPTLWHRQVMVLFVGGAVLLGIVIYVIVACVNRSAAVQRVWLTRFLSTVLVATAAIVVMAVVDTLGQTLYILATSRPPLGPVLTPAGLAGVLVWLAKRLAAKGTSLPGWASKVPMYTLAGLAGIVIFVLVGSLWGLLVHWIVWDGQRPSIGPDFLGDGQRMTLLFILGISIVLSTVTGQFAGFINLSSLQSFYSARLTRAYLGASNGERFKPDGAALSAAEPLPSDNLVLEDYYGHRPGRPKDEKVLTTFAPLHIINVTVNKTVDPSEQLVQRDRKGQPLAVLPFGFHLDSPECASFQPPRRMSTNASRPLSIGQWIGTSGAAFSTGIGRETSLGMSLLMGAANVRLGTWWASGLDKQKFLHAWDWIRRGIGVAFRTQTYISYELRARFFGTARAWQYLSDGGHFENTGIYELLRPERKVRQIFACDDGADPGYRFEDLANLIRLARIDLNVEVEVETNFTGDLASVFARPEAFKRMSPCIDPAVNNQPTPTALLLWAYARGARRPSTQIIVIKPNVPHDAEADVRQYALDHDKFPQEPTADQFFDEAQWESYRALGSHLGGKIFNARILKALDALAAQRMGTPKATFERFSGLGGRADAEDKESFPATAS